MSKIRKPGFWLVLEFAAFLVVMFGAWNEPLWRYALIVIFAQAYMVSDRKYWQARAAQAEASDA